MGTIVIHKLKPSVNHPVRAEIIGSPTKNDWSAYLNEDVLGEYISDKAALEALHEIDTQVPLDFGHHRWSMTDVEEPKE